jgi:DMSO/TMAO reductase YedYZ molybdopterin-dependent catalytic subunit
MPLDQCSLTIDGEVDAPRRWTWDEFLALPSETVIVDIHCVTEWSKLDTTWTGVPVHPLLDGLDSGGEFVTAWCDGDDT